jgi:hypothetical protein
MRSQRILKSVVGLTFVLLVSTAVWGQEYQIVRAEYGAGNRWVDVTHQLQEIAASNPTFRMGNSTFGVDPAPGVVKSLRILARNGRGRERTFQYREGSTVDGSMFAGWGGGAYSGGGYWGGGGQDADAGQYRIVRAEYGAGNSWVDVTGRLREIASTDARFRMGNSTFDVDPAPGTVKSLRILARAPRGGMRTFEYREGSTVDGAMFSGWSRGEWGEGFGGGYGGGYGDDADAGQYRIMRAEYGAGNRWVNVTGRLRQIASTDARFRMGNSTFDVDPAPGQVKILRILARGPRGGTRTFEYREGSTVDGALFSGWSGGDWGDRDDDDDRRGWRDRDDRHDRGDEGGQYQIVKAEYGAGNRWVNVTQRLREIASSNNTFRMGNSTFGVDPAPGSVKTLRILAKDPRGSQRTFEYREGSTVDGSIFSGWGRGDWGR